MVLKHRRGVARSEHELVGQLRSYDKLLVGKARKQKMIDGHRADIKKIDAQLKTLERNLGRYHSLWLNGLTKSASKILRTAAGSLSSRLTAKCEYDSEEQVVQAVLESGRFEFLQKPKLNQTALKNDPVFAVSVGVTIVNKPSLIVSTPHKQTKP